MTDDEAEIAAYWLAIAEAYKHGWDRGAEWGARQLKLATDKAFTDGWDKGFASRAGWR